jgi:nucleoside phosphorylase
MPSELRPVVKVLGLRRDGDLGPYPRYAGRRGDVDVVATGTGIGPALAAEATVRLLDALTLDLVIVSGIAGGIESASAVGDLVVPADVVDGATGDRFVASPPAGIDARGTIRTGDGDDYALTAAQLAGLRDEGVVAVDMETAAVARACQERGVPWVAFRGISDMAGDETVGAVVLTLVNADGSPKVGAGLRFLLGHPGRVPRLVRLARESGHAARIAAEATASACR